MSMGGAYNFYGFDLTTAVRYLDPGESGYVDPNYLVDQVIDSIQAIYMPMLGEKSTFFRLSPKLLLHYHNQVTDNITFGVTGQAAFQTGNISHVITAGSMQNWHRFSFFENLNLHGFTDLTFGGGIQYEGRYAQIFAATDDLFAFYHPAANKTFSLSFGMCFLIGKEAGAKSQKKSNLKGRKGKTSEYLPFYEELR